MDYESSSNADYSKSVDRDEFLTPKGYIGYFCGKVHIAYLVLFSLTSMPDAARKAEFRHDGNSLIRYWCRCGPMLEIPRRFRPWIEL